MTRGIAKGSQKSGMGLEALQESTKEASQHAQWAYFLFLLASLYLTIIISSTTHEQLLLKSNVQLPLFGVGMDIVGFYAFIPWMYLLIHLYLLFQLYFLSLKLHPLEKLIVDTVPASAVEEGRREEFQKRLFPFLFNHMLIGHHRPFLHRLLRFMMWVTAVFLPFFLLAWVQWRFLPYHAGGIAWGQRAAQILDVIFVWTLWPRILHPTGRSRAWYEEEIWKPLAAIFQNFSIKKFRTPVAPKIWWQNFLKTLPDFPGITLLSAGITGFVLFCSLFVFALPGKWNDWTRDWTKEDREKWDQILTDIRLPRNIVLPDKRLVKKKPSNEILAWYAAKYEKKDRPLEEAWLKYSEPLNLQGRDLRFANFRNARLYKVDLRGANLEGANLSGADLRGADFNLLDKHLVQKDQTESLVNFTIELWRMVKRWFGPEDIEMEITRERNVSHDPEPPSQPRLTQNSERHPPPSTHPPPAEAPVDRLPIESVLRNPEDRPTNLRGANLAGARLEGTKLRYAKLKDAIFFTKKRNGIIIFTKLSGMDLSFVQLEGANLQNALLHGANLKGANLQGANLENALLPGANLQEANLQGSTLRQAILHGANLQKAQLQLSTLSNAQLQGADLTGARLQGAVFYAAWLQGAILRDAILYGTDFRKSHLRGASLLTKIVMSDLRDLKGSEFGEWDDLIERLRIIMPEFKMGEIAENRMKTALARIEKAKNKEKETMKKHMFLGVDAEIREAFMMVSPSCHLHDASKRYTRTLFDKSGYFKYCDQRSAEKEFDKDLAKFLARLSCHNPHIAQVIVKRIENYEDFKPSEEEKSQIYPDLTRALLQTSCRLPAGLRARLEKAAREKFPELQKEKAEKPASLTPGAAIGPAWGA